MNLGGWSTKLTPNLYLVPRLDTRGSTNPFPTPIHIHYLVLPAWVQALLGRYAAQIDITDVSGQPISPIFKNRVVKKKTWRGLTLEDAKNMLSRNVENIYAV